MSNLLGEPTFAENLARRFHEVYESLAPLFDYRTRRATAVPWEDVPEANRRLMVATCEQIANDLREHCLRALRAAEKERGA